MKKGVLAIGLILILPLALAHEEEANIGFFDSIAHKILEFREKVFAENQAENLEASGNSAEQTEETSEINTGFLSLALLERLNLENQEAGIQNSEHSNHLPDSSRIDLHIKKKSWY